MGCCGSRKRYERLSDLERGEVHGKSTSHPPHQRPEEFCYETEGRTSHKREESEFFQIFFSALDHVAGYQGILRRWEREAQRADCYAGSKYDMRKVWADGTGYIRTLQNVKRLVCNQVFTWSDRAKLAEWAAKVVKRRSKEYNSAKAQGKADSKHWKALEEWRRVKDTVQGLLQSDHWRRT